MDPDYQKNIDGLSSSDPKTLLDSALWFVNNADQKYYMQACDILYKASLCDSECVRYIAQNIQQDLVFFSQLFSQILRDSNEPEVKQTAIMVIEKMIDYLKTVKQDSTEIISQVYSCLQEAGNDVVLTKAKELL